MTTTLREKILKYVYQHRFEEYGQCDECAGRTDEIIKLFENLIDDLIDKTHKEARRIPEDQPDYLYFRAKAIGMQQVKEELEK